MKVITCITNDVQHMNTLIYLGLFFFVISTTIHVHEYTRMHKQQITFTNASSMTGFVLHTKL